MNTTFSHRTLQALYEAAYTVLQKGESPELLRGPLMELNEMVQFRESARGQSLLKKARDQYIDSCCDIDIDDDTFAYHNGANGCWVMAWCFIPDADDESDIPPDHDLPLIIKQCPGGRES